MRVYSQPIILRQNAKKNYIDTNMLNRNDYEQNKIKNKIVEIYNSLYEDNFYLILTISKTSFLNRIDLKGKEIIDLIYKNNTNISNIIQKIKIDINLKYTEDYTVLHQSYKSIKNKSHHFNFLTNFRKHCEKTDEYAYHTCINNKLEKFYEIRDDKMEIKYLLCPDCKYCFLSNCIRMVCKNCNKEYFSSIIPLNQDKNILLATWEKYHCGSKKNQTMKCIKCRRDLYINLISNKIVCMNKSCNFSSKPLSILWKCSKCGKDFRSKPKIFNPTELEIIQKAINLTLLIKKKAYPKELPCCHKNPENINFYHKEECKGILYSGMLLDREIVVCSKCHAMNFEEKYTWTCPNCDIKFHLHQLTSIKPFKARRYIVNREHSIFSKKNNKNNLNLRNMKNEINDEYNLENIKNESNYAIDVYQSIQTDNSSSLLHNNYKRTKENNTEHNNNNTDYDYEKKVFSDKEHSYSNDGYYRKNKRLSSIKMDEERDKNEEINNNNSQNISIGKKKLDFGKNHNRRGRRYKTLLEILEKRKQKESIIKSGRHLTNSEYSFNDINSNNNYDAISTEININKEGINTYNKTTRNINFNNKNDSKWQKTSEMKDINEDDNFIYKKKTNISSYKKSNMNIEQEKNCSLNDYKSQVNLLKEKQKNKNISDFNNIYNYNENNENEKYISTFNVKNNLILTNSYIVDNESISKKSINNSYKTNKDFQNKLNNSSLNIIENGIYRYSKRNTKKSIINHNIDNGNMPLNKEFHTIKNNSNNNRLLSSEDLNYNSTNRLKVGEYNRKNRRFNRIRNNYNNDNSKEKININININDNENNHKKTESNNNYLIYQNTKNYFLKFTLRQSSTINKNEKHENYNKEREQEQEIKSGEKPIKVSRIYHNKIINKANDKNKITIEDDKDLIIKDNNEESENKINRLTIKKSHENFSMSNIIVTPDKINLIQKKCIIPDFKESEYKYLRPIGEGSYGMIFLVKHIKTNKEYALKKILCKNVNEIIKHKNQLELIYSMKHENIMKIYNLQIKYLDLTTYSLYIIMERAIGDWSLDIRKRMLTKNYYKENEIINILKQVVSALLYLEERKIAHRDIKPQNILIFPGKIYKVADLGEAKNIDNVNRELTLRGSELYMSPLVYQKHKLNKRDLIHNVFKSDVFSLGYSTLYAICLNLNVLEDMREMDDMNKIINIVQKYFNKNLFSEKLYRLIINMIEIDEKKRYSFKQIEKELKHW